MGKVSVTLEFDSIQEANEALAKLVPKPVIGFGSIKSAWILRAAAEAPETFTLNDIASPEGLDRKGAWGSLMKWSQNQGVTLAELISKNPHTYRLTDAAREILADASPT